MSLSQTQFSYLFCRVNYYCRTDGWTWRRGWGILVDWNWIETFSTWIEIDICRLLLSFGITDHDHLLHHGESAQFLTNNSIYWLIDLFAYYQSSSHSKVTLHRAWLVCWLVVVVEFWYNTHLGLYLFLWRSHLFSINKLANTLIYCCFWVDILLDVDGVLSSHRFHHKFGISTDFQW